jgi:hypothetical protein
MFIGEFKDGEIIFGKIKCYNYTYEGDIKNRKANGKGIWISADGFKNLGFFKDGKEHGFMGIIFLSKDHKTEEEYDKLIMDC